MTHLVKRSISGRVIHIRKRKICLLEDLFAYLSTVYTDVRSDYVDNYGKLSKKCFGTDAQNVRNKGGFA